MPAKPSITPLSARLLLVLASTAIGILAVEGVFRAIGFDFEAGQEDAYEAYPIFYRQPRQPFGEVFFHREGPASWTGPVLTTAFRLEGGLDDAYRDEPDATITYDTEGFRNPNTLTTWDVVVVGDSFVELGHLPYEDLFTTQLGRLLDVRVKNLGASYSGPYTYTAFLNHFGVAPRARHAMMVFFEGNDLIDLQREAAWQQTFIATGERPYRAIERQPSFLKASYRLLRRLVRGEWQHTRFFRNASVEAQGTAHAATVTYTPPEASQLSPALRTTLDEALEAWARAAQAQGMRPWLVYMPCKRRVLDSHLRFTAETPHPLATWHPTDLPAFLKQRAQHYAIDFIDVTPALRRETQHGQMTYNLVWDTHLNAHGAAVVAQTLADTLRDHLVP